MVSKLQANNEVRTDPSASSQKAWHGVVVIALVGCFITDLVVSKRQTSAVVRPSPEQERITALANQICSLTQTDLIVFPDGRVWYVRSVRGKNMEVVGWVGGNSRYEDIDSFVLRESHVTIVPHNNPAWPVQRDRFPSQ